MAKKCGATTRDGGSCNNTAIMPNGRCRMHGGASTGAKNQTGNSNAVTHGFYSNALLPHEKTLWSRVELGSIDDEIRLLRVKLHRLVELSGSSDVADLIDAAIEVSRRHEGNQRLGDFDKTEIKVKTNQYADLIIQAVSEIRKLELQRLQMKLLEQKIEEGGGADSAREIVGFEVLPYE